mgnify:FL=1
MKGCFLIITPLLLCLQVAAQEKLTRIQAPSSPASYILGIEPSTVLEPKTYRALETALYSNFTDNNSFVIPNDFGLEFTPYWATDHGLTLSEYLYPGNIPEQVKRTSSLSVASTQNFMLGDSTTTSGIGLGYRTSLFFPCRKDRDTTSYFTAKLHDNGEIITKVASGGMVLILGNTVNNKEEFLDAILTELQNELKKQGFTDAQVNAITGEFTEKYNEIEHDFAGEEFISAFNNLLDVVLEGETVFNNLIEYLGKRNGLRIDFAYALMLNFPTHDLEFSVVPRQSLWITPALRFRNKLDFLEALLVFRYEWYSYDYYRRYFPEREFYENNKDLGLSLKADFEKFSLRFEWSYRWSRSEIPSGLYDDQGRPLYSKDENNDYHYMGSFSYRLGEQVALTYSLGSRFEPFFGDHATLISLLNLNLGFGAPDSDDIKFNIPENK